MAVEQTNLRWEGFPSDVLVDLRPQHGRGLRERLEHGLRAAIQTRRLVAGAALPPTRVLAAELGISRSVVVAAYANLAPTATSRRARAPARACASTSATTPRRDPRAPGATAGAAPGCRPVPPIRTVGGLPDPALFPRTQWLRHYRAALAELPDPLLTYPDTRGAKALRARADRLPRPRPRRHRPSPSRLLVCAGVTQGLTLVCRALRRDGARRSRSRTRASRRTARRSR